MKWIEDNKGNVAVTFLAVMLGIFLGLMVYGWNFNAEAVIGGMGNITDSGNPHNLSNSSSGIRASTETQICIFCHTPHTAIQDADLINAPLWNHTLSTQSYLVKTPGIYNSGTGMLVNLLSTPPSSPDGASKLCLSCHDGTVGIGDVASRSSEIEMDNITNSCISDNKLVSGAGCNAYIGNDLTQKHVVSIPMNLALTTASYANCGAAGQDYYVSYPWEGKNPQGDVVLLRPTNSKYPTGGSPGVTRSSGKYKSGYNYGVQCSTCHDPHLWADTSYKQSEGYKFLVTGFDNLCLACHDSCTP